MCLAGSSGCGEHEFLSNKCSSCSKPVCRLLKSFNPSHLYLSRIFWRSIDWLRIVRSRCFSQLKDFDETSLGRYVTPTFGIVLLAIPQQRVPAYAAVFANLWPSNPQTFVG